MPTKPGLKTKLKYAGLEEIVADWIFKDKISYSDIVDKLKKEYDIDLTEGSISNFKKTIMKMASDFLTQNEAYRDLLAKKFLDTVENLIYALEKIKEKIEEFDDPKKWRQQSIYLNLMLSELHLLLKRSGEIKPSQFIEKQEITMIQINQIVQLELVRLIDEGQIPLEHCSPQVKEFYKKTKAIPV